MNTVAPVSASVVVLSIQDYARQAVMEQVRLKDAIEALVRAALAPVAPARRSGLRGGPAHAVLDFEITPRGEVYIDDELKGSSPPLTRIEIPPGRHAIEVRYGKQPSLKVEVNPGPAEELTIAHAFATPRSAGKARDGWRSLRRSAGF